MCDSVLFVAKLLLSLALNPVNLLRGMLSQATIKSVRALHSSHIAKKTQRFVVEGRRLVDELLRSGLRPIALYCLAEEMGSFAAHCPVGVSNDEMARMSHLDSPPTVLGIFPRSEGQLLPLDTGYHLYLENIQDPGNLGTIVRTAAWFGFKQVICSEDSVSIFNSKALQASMGGIGYTSIVYSSFEKIYPVLTPDTAIVATSLEGEPLRRVSFRPPTLFLFGNEGHGLSPQLLEKAKVQITIPRGDGGQGDSLNVATAVGIVCAAASYFK